MQDMKKQMVNVGAADEIVLDFGLPPQIPVISREERQVARASIRKDISARARYGEYVYEHGRNCVIYIETYAQSDDLEKRAFVETATEFMLKHSKQKNQERQAIARAVFSLLRIEFYLELDNEVFIADVGRLLDSKLAGNLFRVTQEGKGTRMFGKSWEVVEAVRDIKYTSIALRKFRDLKNKAALNGRDRDKKQDEKWTTTVTSTLDKSMDSQPGRSRTALPKSREENGKVTRPSILFWDCDGVYIWPSLILGAEASIFLRAKLEKVRIPVENIISDQFKTNEYGRKAHDEKTVWNLFHRCRREEVRKIKVDAEKTARAAEIEEAKKTEAKKADSANAPNVCANGCGKEFAPKARKSTIEKHMEDDCPKAKK